MSNLKGQILYHIEKDIEDDAMVYGYYYYFNTDAESVSGIYFPRIYPPGSGLIINRKLHRGLHEINKKRIFQTILN